MESALTSEPPRPGAETSSTVHSYNVRICHWVNVVACTYLLVSGVHIFLDFPELYWGLRSVQVVDSVAGFGRGTGGINSDIGFHWFAGV